MVDCESLFKKVRSQILSQDGLSLFVKHFKIPSRIGDESRKPKRNYAAITSRRESDNIQHKHKQKQRAGNARSNDGPISHEHNESSLFGQTLSARQLDEFKQLLSSDIEVRTVSWSECEKSADIQASLYHTLGRGIVQIIDIPKIPPEYEPEDRMYLGIDTEDSGTGIPHFYQIATRDAVYISSSWRLLMRYVTQKFELKRNNHIVWGTNIEYEFGNICKDFDQEVGTMEVKWRKSKLNSFKLIYDPEKLAWANENDKYSTMVIWDTTTHWMRTVEKLGEALNKKFVDLNVDFSKLEKNFYGFKYAAMDAIISRSYACMQRYYYEGKGINLKSTPGGTAMGLYAQKDGPFCGIKLYNTHKAEDLAWLEGGMRGGRTEVFSLREHTGRIMYLDINSAYPYAMKSFPNFPDPNTGFHLHGHDRIRSAINAGLEGMAECEVEAINVQEFASVYPYLGARDNKTGRFMFPLGKWKSRYTFYEIRKAEILGYKFKFNHAIAYQLCKKHPFKDYVDFCYDLRLEGSAKKDDMLKDIGKSLGNNLFGKFSQKKVFTVVDDPEKYKPEDLLKCAWLGSQVIIEKNEGYAIHTNMIWSAYVTAITRDLLYNHMMNAWATGNVILYCDTDSIFISGGALPKNHPTELGALKHEFDLYQFRAYLPKQYSYTKLDLVTNKAETSKGKTVVNYKAKGVPSKFTITNSDGTQTEVLLHEQFFTTGKVEFRKPLKIREALRRKNIRGIDKRVRGVDAVNAWITVEKELKGGYTKREVLPTGWTLPHWIGMKKPDWYQPPERFNLSG